MKSNKDKILNFFINQKLLFIIIALIIILTAKDKSFFTVKSLVSILDHVTIQGIMAAGMTILLISGSFDLSVGSVLAMSGIATIMLQRYGMLVSISGGLLTGVVIGAINGALVVKGKINAFIATLGTFIIFRGLGLGLTHGPIKGTIENFPKIAQGSLFGIPNNIFFLAITYLVVWYVLKYTKFGRNDYAIGSNPLSARTAGINVNLNTFFYFVACSFAAAVAGVLLSSKVNTGNPVFGDNVPMLVIAAAVLGGTSLFGGKGGVIGTIQGVIILGLVERAMVIFNVDTNYQLLVRGSILLAVIITDAVTSNRQRKLLTA
ncbi:MAG: ABC transporter permease [Actinobacteria bacterium]|nr:ABC transporter permease [Actinomycetota bacterium]